MATIKDISPAPWRMQFITASYGGVEFHVEQQARSTGRRVVTHEYPKRDLPYAEDMGRHAIRFAMTGYLVGPDYHLQKEALIDVLERSEGASLMDPYRHRELMCICERYSVTEVRERGGYCVFEMSFVEIGSPGNSQIQTDTNGNLVSAANNTGSSAAASLDGFTADEAQRRTA